MNDNDIKQESNAAVAVVKKCYDIKACDFEILEITRAICDFSGIQLDCTDKNNLLKYIKEHGVDD